MNYKVLADNTKTISRKKWLKIRQQGLGGSDIGALFKLNKYKSLVQLYMEKISEEVENVETLATKFGNFNEEFVAKLFEEETGKKVQEMDQVLQHKEKPYLLANIDRLVIGENAFLECKTTSAYNEGQWLQGKAPDAYILQCQHYLNILGMDKCYLACLIGNHKFVYYEIYRDQEIIEMIEQRADWFWNTHVNPRVCPTFDGSKVDTEILNKIYPVASEENTLQFDLSIDKMIEDRFALERKLKALQEQIDGINNVIKGHMKENQKAITPNYIINWKNCNRSSLDTKKLKEEMPEVYQNYFKTTTYRKFDIKEVNK